MERANTLICPSCAAPLKSERGIRTGKKITCPKCGVAFTVRPEDAERAAATNPGRLAVVLVGALLYLLGGGTLAVYCFKTNDPRGEGAKVEPGSPVPVIPADDGDTAAPAKQTTPPKPNRVSPQEQRKIDRAIADGVWFLKEHVRADGAWGDSAPGLGNLQVAFASLPALTLLECGVPADDPVVQKAAKLVRAQAAAVNVRSTYQLALAILFLDRLEEYRNRQERDRSLIQHLALRLIAGQRADGGWSYDCPALDPKMVSQLLAKLQGPTQSLEDWHKFAVPGEAFEAGGWDNSNTQFAILALWVAGRHQVPIDMPIGLAEKHFRATQLHAQAGAILGDANNVNLDGSWFYNADSNSSAWPSMTCAGLLGLAIGRGVSNDPKEKNQKPLDDPAIKAGLAMLGREIDRAGEKREADHYFLWSVQRVGVLYDLDLIDGKDWYAWGCKKLLPPAQKNDGSWTGGGVYVGENTFLNTCFALLFLKRANLVKDLTDKLQFLASPTGVAAPGSAPPAKKE
jgi:hypothetical protein